MSYHCFFAFMPGSICNPASQCWAFILLLGLCQITGSLEERTSTIEHCNYAVEENISFAGLLSACQESQENLDLCIHFLFMSFNLSVA